VITVADDGPGVGPAEAARLFERFYRVDPSRSRRYGGAGLGLSIVDSITRAHGGRVSAAPGVPRGSVFTIRLPAEPVAGAAESPADRPGHDSQLPLS
jgi:two-component system OmpR family sensor kinase